MKYHAGILITLIAAAISQRANADLSFATSGTVSSYLAPSGAGTLQYTSVAATLATVAQGNASLASGAPGFSLSETFTPSSSYTLGGISLLGGVSIASTTLSLHLYDVTGVDKQGSGAFYNPGTDLFGNGSGLSFTVTPTGESQFQFSLSNGSTLDQISLISGRTYALEIWTPAAVGQNNFQWYRGGVVATDGQMMGSHDYTTSVSRNTIAALGLAGGAPRTASLALYAAVPVPEPSSLTLLAMAGAGLIGWRRRQRA